MGGEKWEQGAAVGGRWGMIGEPHLSLSRRGKERATAVAAAAG
jgi:hypothetical protein